MANSRALSSVKNEVYRIFARYKLVVVQLRQDKIIITINYLRAIVAVRVIQRFTNRAPVGNNSDGGARIQRNAIIS
jgi:hypothetical protein